MLTTRYCAALLVFIGFTTAAIQEKGWWRNTVFYQIYPRSFKDNNNDGIGDLRGITDKLQHFKDAGIGAVWLSPIYASPMVDFGYDISDFRKIDESYGTMADFETLTATAKRMGIKVILDLVPNHTSDKHEWFVKSVQRDPIYSDYYIWRPRDETDPEKLPNNWISVFSGPAWTVNEERDEWYFHQFEYRQPDLNYANPNVRREMEEVIKFWLSKGVDGFRVDAVPHIYEVDDLRDEPRSMNPNATPRDYTYLTHNYTKDDPRTYALVQSWRNILDTWADTHDDTEKIMMIEAYTTLSNTLKYYQYGAQMPFNFFFITDVTATTPPQTYKKIMDNWMQSMSMMEGDYVANWVMGNHDRPRIATRFPGRNDQMTMLAMILPGVTVTYYGEEIGMEDYKDISWEDTQDPQACNAGEEKYLERSRDPNRTPFQWDDTTNAGFNTGGKTWVPVHPNYKTLNLAAQARTNQSHYKVYQALTTLKHESPALKEGSYKSVVLNNNNVLGVVREKENETVILLINFSNTEQQIVNLTEVVQGKYKEGKIHIANAEMKGVTWGTEVKLDAVELPAKASFVLLPRNDSINGKPSGASSHAYNQSAVIVALCLAAVLRMNFM